MKTAGAGGSGLTGTGGTRAALEEDRGGNEAGGDGSTAVGDPETKKEEDTATGAARRAPHVPEPASTPPAELGPCCSQRRAAGYFVYSIVLAVLSVYNALATGSFAWTSGSIYDKNVVFSMSAILETSGLAFGVGMSIRQYINANEQSLWSDMLSEPYIIALEGMFGVGERGRTLFLAGLKGTLCQGLFGSAVLFAVRIRLEGNEVENGIFIAVELTLLLLVLSRSCSNLQNADTLLFAYLGSVFYIFPLMIEVLEAYHLIVSGASVVNCTLVVMDALAIVPLAVITVGLCVAGPLYYLRRGIYAVARRCCPSSCGEPVELLNPERGVSFMVRQLARINVLEHEGNGQQPGSLDSNARPAPAV